MTGRLQGRVAFITGAARGQGRAHAVRFAQEGADVIAVDLCDQPESTRGIYAGATEADLDQTVKEVEALDRRIVASRVDVRDGAGLRAAVADGVAQLGRLDAVVANAGIFSFGQPAHEVSDDDWKEILDVNLTGVWQTCKAATPAMLEGGRGGSITITSSTAGLKGTPSVAPYTASKHAVVGLMRTLALELGPHSIRVNTIHPTGVATPMILNEPVWRLFLPGVEHPTQEQGAEAFAGTNALPVPWVEPVDIANAALFLASDDARYVTGTELKVDAGYTTR